MRPRPTVKPESPKRTPAPWVCEVKLELITRLFGGGAKAREIDAISWLRSSAAKCALRAWWRAGAAHRFTTLDALRAQEQALFGSPGRYDDKGKPAGGPGPLDVTVRAQRPQSLHKYDGKPSDPLNVALFPAAGMGQPAAHLAHPDTTPAATVRLVSTDTGIEAEILAALRLWLTLGGAGARTRRGAGALAAQSQAVARSIGLPATVAELQAFLLDRCTAQTVSPQLAGVFALARTRSVFVGPMQREAEMAQRKLLEILRQARQERRPGSHQSRWPEADAIRLKHGGRYAHRPLPGNAEQYPRAVLGLPIVVHYKDRPPAEPPDHHILAAIPPDTKLERFASPILLRPVRIFQGDRPQYLPVALFTDCTLPAASRPLVVQDPRAPVAPADVVPSYDLQAHAAATLAHVESFFAAAPGFQRL